MSNYRNAYNYIEDLKTTVNMPWFSKICDLAIVANRENLTEEEKIEIQSIYFKEKSYSSSSSSPSLGSSSSSSGIPPIKIEHINGFNCFKRLSNTLKIKFEKRATLIFGANGSGKSSICDTFKIIGDLKPLGTPISNLVDSTITGQTSFKYKLNNVPETTWTDADAYGLHNNKIKIFDSHIALKYIQSPVDPTTMIELTPFGLHAFDYIEKFLSQHKDKTDEFIETKQNTVQLLTEKNCILFRNNISEHKNKFTDGTTLTNLDSFKKFVRTFKNIDIDQPLKDKKKELNEFELALSPEGKRALSTEINVINQWITEVKRVLKKLKPLELKKIQETINNLDVKQKKQETLTEAISLNAVDFQDFKIFLIAVKEVFDFEKGSSCPFCRQEINDSDTKELIDKYKYFLDSSLEKEIQILNGKLATLLNSFMDFKNMDTSRIVVHGIEEIPEATCNSIVTLIKLMQSKIPDKEKKSEFKSLLPSDFDVKNSISFIKPILRNRYKKEKTLKALNTGKETQEKRLKTLKAECANLELKEIFKKNNADFNNLILKIEATNKLNCIHGINDFSLLRRKVSQKSRTAHTELLVSEFAEKLNNEYVMLAEKPMESFNIKLKSSVQGISNISVSPRIGGEKLEVVLSEGELKIHALALFFTEYGYSNEDIIVLDDPVNSLDEKYCFSVAERIRDLIRNNSEKQVIIFTHNYSFFMLLQKTFNQSNLNNFYHSIIIEDCKSAEKHEEKIDKIKDNIKAFLFSSTFGNYEKEILAKYMRQLIESIINKHVFNETRWQYKQHDVMSEFSKYQKLVPLKESEANDLRDLYRKLSPWEHDDCRTWYLNSDKAVFQTRLDKITDIEDAILSRR